MDDDDDDLNLVALVTQTLAGKKMDLQIAKQVTRRAKYECLLAQVQAEVEKEKLRSQERVLMMQFQREREKEAQAHQFKWLVEMGVLEK